MKVLIAAALFVASTAAGAAGIIANVQNEAGGRIELSDIKTEDPGCKGYIAKTWGGGRPDNYGCWRFGPEGDTVQIRWVGDSTGITYPTKAFTLTPYGMQIKNQKQL